jgi:hypothetical protein
MREITSRVLDHLKESLYRPQPPISASFLEGTVAATFLKYEECIFYHVLIQAYLSKAIVESSFTEKEVLKITANLTTFENMRDYVFIIIAASARTNISIDSAFIDDTFSSEIKSLNVTNKLYRPDFPFPELLESEFKAAAFEAYERGVFAFYLIRNYLYNAITLTNKHTEAEALEIASKLSDPEPILNYATTIINELAKVRIEPQPVELVPIMDS